MVLYLFLFFWSTTNGSESFHRTYKAQFNSSHPFVHVVISILKDTQVETLRKFNQYLKIGLKKMENAGLIRIKESIEEYNKYKIYRNIIT